MLQFHFDFVDRFVSREDYQLCEMDTDSLYLALSTPSLEAAVRPHLLPQFYQEWPLWFPAQACDDHREEFIKIKLSGQDWKPAPCCLGRQKLDKRTPGLFKIEFQGEGIVALCSKTYYCFGENTDDKYSCKGLNKRLNTLTKDSYMDVLKTQINGGGTNIGFRAMNGHMYTYQQHRDALSFFYIKRQVLSDGVSTIPLLI
jgi:hypothetical protein